MRRSAVSLKISSLFACLSIFLLHGANLLGDQYIEVTGQIQLLTYRTKPGDEGKIKNNFTYSVSSVVGNEKWWVQNNYVINADQSWCYDGSNVYSSSKITKDPSLFIPTNIPNMPAPSKSWRTNITQTIRPSKFGYPFGNPGVNIPWLAFCSGAFLNHKPSSMPLPTDLARNMEPTPDYPVAVTQFADELGLPEHLTLFEDQERTVVQFQVPMLRRARMFLGGGFRRSFTLSNMAN